MNWTHLQIFLENYTRYLESQLKDSIPSNYNVKNNVSFNISIGNSVFEITFNAPGYFKYIEDGRRPGKMPPIEPIENWITRRRIIAYPQRNRTVPTKKQLAFLIARSIGKKGIEGKHFLEDTIDNTDDYLETGVIENMTLDIQEEINNFISPLEADVRL